MGCLKSLITKLIIILLLVAFFYFGGVQFVSDVIKKYQNPPREVVLKQAERFGDFARVESDYKIGRTYNFPKYAKMTAIHKPSGQKITFVHLKNQDIPEIVEFTTKVVDNSLQNFIKTKDINWLDVDEIKIEKTGKIPLKSRQMDYVEFSLTVNRPIKQDFKGVFAIYNYNENNEKAENKGGVTVFSFRGSEKFSKKIFIDLLQTVDFR